MRRFYTLDEIAEQLNVSLSQVRSLVKTGDLLGIQIGGRGQWRVEDTMLDEYISGLYEKQRKIHG